ncbi:BnaC05g51580D [Brassica napus]|uniref:BnaC05g51580D protein n=2 Tax=Brassica napus TaxID=3708 RepID=A0A078IU06_BRANA|nr:BnaC05g51580D [Brassica napus]
MEPTLGKFNMDKFDGLFGPTRRTGELDGAFDPTRLSVSRTNQIFKEKGFHQHIVGILVLSYEMVTNPLPLTPDGLRTVRYLLLSGSSFWALFTPKRVRRAVALHLFWFRPDLPVEEGAESSMDGFVLYVAPAKRERSRPRKGKHVIVDDDVAVGQGYPTDNILKQVGAAVTRLTSTSCLTLIDLAGVYQGVEDGQRELSQGLLMINRALNVSNQEACMAQFKAEMADKEIAGLKDKLECPHRRERGSAVTEIHRAYRRGKREMAEASVSPGTVESETGVPDETGQVNQPKVPLDFTDYSMGGIDDWVL